MTRAGVGTQSSCVRMTNRQVRGGRLPPLLALEPAGAAPLVKAHEPVLFGRLPAIHVYANLVAGGQRPLAVRPVFMSDHAKFCKTTRRSPADDTVVIAIEIHFPSELRRGWI